MAKLKLSSQEKLMVEIYDLLIGNLSYIYGEKECGPNGNKKKFLDKSARFLRALANDCGFTEFRVSKNPSGIAVSGNILLYGMWNEQEGVMFDITQSFNSKLLYRKIKSLKDYKGDRNQWISYSLFKEHDYTILLNRLLKLETRGAEANAA